VRRRGSRTRRLHNLIECARGTSWRSSRSAQKVAAPAKRRSTSDLLHVWCRRCRAPGMFDAASPPGHSKGPGWAGCGREQAHLPAQALADCFALGDVSSLPPPRAWPHRGQAAGVGGPTCWPSSHGLLPYRPSTTAIRPARLITGFCARGDGEFGTTAPAVSSFLVASNQGSAGAWWLVENTGVPWVYGIGVLKGSLALESVSSSRWLAGALAGAAHQQP